ncbi:glycoside hydrolase family 19 protein [Streptomyces sp. NPDC098781]|uniref:glycoside hydrolase family 19 protein n=1 Tax=Streptomyces sp. NPDC098781 TaxID=3366097 RepID=UPI00382A4033
MSRRITTLVAAFAVAVGIAVNVPTAPAVAADCSGGWNSSSVYWGGMTASHDGHNWQAKWWSQSETPSIAEVWVDQGPCGSGDTAPEPAPVPDGGSHDPSRFVVSEAQFDQMFPNRAEFYTYSGLTQALRAYPAFANTGSDRVRKQEAAAFLANVSQETGALAHVVERNTANYPTYCFWGPIGCPAGQSAYYGRGPIQLSWNFNYRAAGDALGIDLINNPWRVERESAVAWKTGLWYWNTQSGPGPMTGHDAVVNRVGFGHTVRSVNGALECDGKNPAQIQSRVETYRRFTQILGVPTGGDLYC